MNDIIEVNDGEDLLVMDSIVAKSGNVLSIQLGDLEYNTSFGVDLRFFLTSELQFQNESFKSYLVQRLTEHQVNVAQVIETINTLFMKYTFQVGSISENNEGLIL
jgi:hypothetical protein